LKTIVLFVQLLYYTRTDKALQNDIFDVMWANRAVEPETKFQVTGFQFRFLLHNLKAFGSGSTPLPTSHAVHFALKV